MPQLLAEFQTQYNALTREAGVVDLSDRTQIEFTGAIVRSFCTTCAPTPCAICRPAEVARRCARRERPHRRARVFVRRPGIGGARNRPRPGRKTARPFRSLFDSRRCAASRPLNRLGGTSSLGPECRRDFDEPRAKVPENRLDHNPAEIAGRQVWLRRVDLAGPEGFLIACRRDDLPTVQNRLSTDAVACGIEVFETARIEVGTPFYGRDITAENLPQEIDRDRLAISSRKAATSAKKPSPALMPSGT